MFTLAKISRLTARIVGLLGAIVIVAMMLHITADVIARYALGSPLSGTLEIVSRYYMVAIAFLPLAWVEHRNQMISVSAFDSLLSRRVVQIRDVVVALISFGAFGLLAWATWGNAREAIERKAFVLALGERIPVWPTYLLLPVGFGLVAIIVLIRVVSIIGTDSTAEEIELGVGK
ncbi:TRAP transporter small permease [Tropicibacter sp. Alg240-R139]|uniref:TRAP transporter small permease n=1 Tax=Tropicibacter sp. Alg240-R139 TaxID=2305991 RepID=UPI0013E0E9B8|nr:TRAP transporter small permease [Tropicibacter sp. Alg240-R139]